MENEVIVSSSRQPPTDVAVQGIGKNRFVAAWSADGATWISDLDGAGHIVTPPKRVERDRGLDAFEKIIGMRSEARDGKRSESDKTFWPSSERGSIYSEDLDIIPLGGKRVVVVMLGRAKRGAPGGAYATVWPTIGGNSPVGIRLGPAGEYATRIAAAAIDNKLIVAWHDGDLASSRIRLARLRTKDLAVEKTSVITRDQILASPVLAEKDGRVVIAWSETVNKAEGTSSFVKTATVSSDLSLKSEFTVATGRFIYPSPDLATTKDGIGLVFRDDEDKDDTPEFHFRMLNNVGSGGPAKKRISQADGLHGPSLIFFDNMFLGATIRSFQRNLLIGLNRFDTSGVKLGGEFQVYADKTDFVRVDISANDKTLLMVYAEDRRNMGRVIAGQVTCSGDRY